MDRKKGVAYARKSNVNTKASTMYLPRLWEVLVMEFGQYRVCQ